MDLASQPVHIFMPSVELSLWLRLQMWMALPVNAEAEQSD